MSAPQGSSLESLRDALLAHDIQPLIPQELSAGSDWASELQRQLVRADLVIGILPTGRQSAWVLFELSQARALGKRSSRHRAARLRVDPLDIATRIGSEDCPR